MFYKLEFSNFSVEVWRELLSFPGGGGGTSLQEATGDVPLDGVAFSRLD